MPIDLMMTSANLLRARTNVLRVCSQGADVVLIGAGSSSSNKDEFGTVKNNSTLTLKSFPTRFTPYDRRVKESISWADDTDIICFVSKMQVDNLNLKIEMLRKKYKDMKHNGKVYEVTNIEPYSAFAGDYLYIVIGGKV